MSAWTIQSLIDGKMHIEAYCQRAACAHHQSLDLIALRDKLGPDAPAMADDLKPKLRCKVCGSKSVGLIYSPTVHPPDFNPMAMSSNRGQGRR